MTTYSIYHIDSEDESWRQIMLIQLPDANAHELNEQTLDGIIKHLDSTVAYGSHFYDREDYPEEATP